MDNLNLSLKKEVYESDFYYSLLKEELDKVISDNNIEYNKIHILTSFKYVDEYDIQFGIYIINTSKKIIQVNNIPLCIYDGDKKIYSEEFLINKIVYSNEAVFIEIKINKEYIKEKYDFDNISLSIDDINSIRKYPYINIDISNVPKIKDYVTYRAMKKFLKDLSIMDKNQLVIDVFASGEIEEGFFIIVLFRNSSSEDINIKSIPLEIYTGDDLIFYKNYFSLLDGGIKVPSYSGLFKVIVIPKDEFQGVEGEDSDTYKVKIC